MGIWKDKTLPMPNFYAFIVKRRAILSIEEDYITVMPKNKNFLGIGRIYCNFTNILHNLPLTFYITDLK